MKRIAVLSDTHSHMDKRILSYLEGCDEVWHAGDVGDIAVTDTLEGEIPLRAVYGNIDDSTVRTVFNEDEIFYCEGVKVYMTHIGGYPKRYKKRVLPIIAAEKPDLVIVGHSHILKVMYDHTLNHLHINPGAIGMIGIHKVRTMVRFSVKDTVISDLEVIELPKTNLDSYEKKFNE